MGIILLIFQIVSAIPTIISVIKMIVELIHNLPKVEQRAAQGQLKGILRRHLKSKNASACKADLEQFHADLKGKYGV